MLTELLNRIDRYLGAEIGLAELEHWLDSHLQEIEGSGDRAAISLSDEIHLDLFEMGDGLFDEDEFRRRVERYARSLRPTVTFDFRDVRPSRELRLRAGQSRERVWVRSSWETVPSPEAGRRSPFGMSPTDRPPERRSLALA